MLRGVVSGAAPAGGGCSVEVVSAENFRQRRDAMAAGCQDCNRQRATAEMTSCAQSHKSKKRRKQANHAARAAVESGIGSAGPRSAGDEDRKLSPAARRQHYSRSSDSSTSTDTDDSSSKRSSGGGGGGGRRHAKTESLRAKAIRGDICSKTGKNFAAFLTAVTQAHEKGSRTVAGQNGNVFSSSTADVDKCKASSTSSNSGSSGSANVRLCSDHPALLNNQRHQSPQLNLQGAWRNPLTSLRATDVQVVRNDLQNNGSAGSRSLSKQHSLDESDKSSVVSSDDVDSWSSSDSVTSSRCSSVELTRCELDYLSSYTAGAPLTCYGSSIMSYSSSAASVRPSTSLSPPTSVTSESESDCYDHGATGECLADDAVTSEVALVTVTEVSSSRVEVSLANFYRRMEEAGTSRSSSGSCAKRQQASKRACRNQNKDMRTNSSHSQRGYLSSYNEYWNYVNEFQYWNGGLYSRGAMSPYYGMPNAHWIPRTTSFMDVGVKMTIISIEQEDDCCSAADNNYRYDDYDISYGMTSEQYQQNSLGSNSSSNSNNNSSSMQFMYHQTPWPYYYTSPSYYGLYPCSSAMPSPITVPRDTSCLFSKRMRLVPGHQIKACKSAPDAAVTAAAAPSVCAITILYSPSVLLNFIVVFLRKMRNSMLVYRAPVYIFRSLRVSFDQGSSFLPAHVFLYLG